MDGLYNDTGDLKCSELYYAAILLFLFCQAEALLGPDEANNSFYSFSEKEATYMLCCQNKTDMFVLLFLYT